VHRASVGGGTDALVGYPDGQVSVPVPVEVAHREAWPNQSDVGEQGGGPGRSDSYQPVVFSLAVSEAMARAAIEALDSGDPLAGCRAARRHRAPQAGAAVLPQAAVLRSADPDQRPVAALMPHVGYNLRPNPAIESRDARGVRAMQVREVNDEPEKARL
jgi:hypothetical protein